MALAQEINRLTGLGGEPRLSRLLGPDGEPLERSDNGKFALPHPITFTSLLNQFSKTYSWRWDEAYKDNRSNALAMRRDAWLMALLRERQMPTAQMSWHLEPDDGKSQEQKDCADYLTKLVEKTPNMQRFKMSLLEALWYGRYGVQVAWKWQQFDGRRTLLAVDHRPVNGDKIQFRYRLTDDGPEVEEGAPAVLVHSAWATRLPAAETVLTDKGRALLLQHSYWRERFVIHKHEVDDADYLEGEMAGAVHGVGIRSRIYWVDWMRREFLSWVSDYMERVGQGVTIFYYEAGNPASEKEAVEAAKKYGRNTVIVWPRPIGSEKQGAGIERMEVNTAGSQFLVDLIKYFDEIERYYIVGQTLSSGDGPTGLGSGLAEAHMDTKFRIVKFDCTNLEETLTSDFISVLKRWNAPQAAGFNIRWKFDIDRPNPKDRLDAAKSVFDMGAKLDEAEVRSFAGLSTPKEGDPVLEQQQQPGGPGGGGGLNEQLKQMAHPNGNGQNGDQNGDQGNGDGEPPNGAPSNGKPAAGLGDRLKGLRPGAPKRFKRDAHGLEHKGPGPGGGQFTGEGDGDDEEPASAPAGHDASGMASDLAKHLLDKLNGDPRKFRQKYADLEDDEKRAVAKELKGRGLLHPIDARKLGALTATDLVRSVSGRIDALRDEHTGDPLNRHVPWEDSDAYKAIAEPEEEEAPPPAKSGGIPARARGHREWAAIAKDLTDAEAKQIADRLIEHVNEPSFDEQVDYLAGQLASEVTAGLAKRKDLLRARAAIETFASDEANAAGQERKGSGPYGGASAGHQVNDDDQDAAWQKAWEIGRKAKPDKPAGKSKGDVVRAKRQATYDANTKAAGNAKVIKLFAEGHGGVSNLIVHPSAKNPGKWQVSWSDEDMVPAGDSQFESFEDAWESANGRSVRGNPPIGSGNHEVVEAIGDRSPRAPADPLAGTRQQTMFARGGLNAQLLRFAKKDAGQWITIGASGPEGDRHGGSPVLVSGSGEILKGHPGLTGKKLGALGEKTKAPEPTAPGDDDKTSPEGRKKVIVGKKTRTEKAGAKENRAALAADKEYRRAVWSKKARKERINPEHLHSLAESLMQDEQAHERQMQDIVDKAREISRSRGYGDIRNIAKEIAKGTVEDPDAIKGLDEMAASLEYSYPEILGGGDPARKLFDILSHGNFTPDAYNATNIRRQQEEAAYDQAFDYLIERRDQEKQRQEEELAAVPFRRN